MTRVFESVQVLAVLQENLYTLKRAHCCLGCASSRIDNSFIIWQTNPKRLPMPFEMTVLNGLKNSQAMLGMFRMCRTYGIEYFKRIRLNSHDGFVGCCLNERWKKASIKMPDSFPLQLLYCLHHGHIVQLLAHYQPANGIKKARFHAANFRNHSCYFCLNAMHLSIHKGTHGSAASKPRQKQHCFVALLWKWTWQL